MSPLCPGCKKYCERELSWCRVCGRQLSDGAPPLELVLADGARVALVQEIMIGRAPRNTIRFTDPSVSRVHARIAAPRGECAPELTDAGSAHGTWVDGARVTRPVPLYDGAAIRVGDSRMRVERPRNAADAGHTMVLRCGMSVVVPIVGAAQMSAAPLVATSAPRLRSGLALKQMPASEGELRWILRDSAGTSILRLGESEAALLELLDGRHTAAELIGEADARGGPAGHAVLLRLLADLAEHGLLADVERAQGGSRPEGLRRLLTPREICFPGAPAMFERLYREGGYLLFTPAGLTALAGLAIAGLVAFAIAIAGDYATPFVVADHIGLGALAFILGRLLVVLCHETAHGLTLATFDRRAERSGVKFILGFPYAFVDTTAALLEPRHRRIAVSASGPLSDLVVGGAFALVCIASSQATTREVSLQVALSAYTGALFNLNPLLDRDGYHMLVDWLGIPKLRHHARDWLKAGAHRDQGATAVAAYALATVVWSLLTVGFVIFLTLRYKDQLLAVAPDGLVWVLIACFWALLLVPAAIGIARPIGSRLRAGEKVAT